MKEQVKAYWILIHKEDGRIICKCSNCKKEQVWPIEKCPNCGAIMELEGEEDGTVE